MCDFASNDKLVTNSLDMVTRSVVKYMIGLGVTLSTAESCTGGMVSEMITSVPGSSAIFLGGVCSYSEEIKMKVLGVSPETLEKYTVYSPQVASEMSIGVKKLMGADAAIGITGIAGPDGYSDDKPVGTVYVSVRNEKKEIVKDLKLYEKDGKKDRNEIRRLAALGAFEMLLELYGLK